MAVVRIAVERHGDIAVLRVNGEIAKGPATALLRRKVRELVESGVCNFVLDMLHVPWLDSSGLGEVVACYKRVRTVDGVVKLVLQGKSRSIFTFTELHRIFEIYDDLESALASFGS